MTHWEISEPQTIDLGAVNSLRLRIVAGDATVTASDGPARLEVHHLKGAPLQVDVDDGVLTIAYEDLSWTGLLGRLRHPFLNHEVSLAVAVPPACEVQLGTVSASAMVSGVTKPTAVRTVSGEITLDGLGAGISAKTVSGTVEALALNGPLEFETVSGDLTVASGRSRAVNAKSVSGEVTIAVELEAGGSLAAKTVSGNVGLRLTEEPGAKVHVKSVSGRLTSAYPDVTLTGRQGLSGAFGDGSGSVNVKTVSGDVDLLGQPAV